MKRNKQDESAAHLGHALREWKVSTPLPVRFKDHVWQRIERAEPRQSVTPWDLLRDWLEAKVRQPVFAISYVTALLVLGLSAGYWRARVDTSKMESSWQARYVQSVDPYQVNHQ